MPLEKLLRPGDGRKSRLRNAQNEMVSASRILRNAPRAAASYLTLKLTGRRPEAPWISYDATRRLDGLLGLQMHVLEYGTGMSTLWFARRVASVIAVDDLDEWIAFQRRGMKARGVSNVTLVHATEEQSYCYPDGALARSFDFIMIDGRFRDACAMAALELIKPGGHVYLDNTDIRTPNEIAGSIGDARELLIRAAAERGGGMEEFNDFPPALLHATTGHLFRL